MLRRTLVSSRGRAFTIIELLVAISVLVLLVALLAPGLKASREQAKRVTCESNLKQINTSLITDITEYDAYPVLFRKDEANCERVSWATWSFGGWTGSDFETYCDKDGGGKHCYHTDERPLSVYLSSPQTIRPDEKGGDGRFGTPDDRVQRMPIFRCPSDTASTQWRWKKLNSSQAVRDMSAYDQCGTSYQMNYYWFYQALDRVPKQPGSCFKLRQWTKAFEIGHWVWRRASEHGASRFVTAVEDPFDWGVAQGLSLSADWSAMKNYKHSICGEQTMGFHGRWSRHVTAFLDGHVDYLYMDTRHQRDSLWTVSHERWNDTRTQSNCGVSGGFQGRGHHNFDASGQPDRQ